MYGHQPGLVGVALAQGLILAVLLAVTLPISGGFLNPAVTLMLWVFNRLDHQRTWWFIGAQLLGAALAGGCLRLTFTEGVLGQTRVGTPHLTAAVLGGPGATANPTVPMLLTGTGIELALTFFLVFAIFGTVLDTRGPRLGGLAVGLALSADMLMGFPLTGAAVNPARWFGTVIWERTVSDIPLVPGTFSDMFVYLAGPILGALLAGGVYFKLILPAETEAPAAGGTGVVGELALPGSTLVKAKK